MINMRIVPRPAFNIIGKQVFITGQDNEQFGRFWDLCRAEGLLARLNSIKEAAGQWAGPQTGGAVLGVSRVESDPNNRAFYYMIGIEAPANRADGDIVSCEVPACDWAVFECHGTPPESIVASEMYAFMEWLPNSEYRHALAPEMEVYPPTQDKTYCEFWLPVIKK